MSVHLFGIRHHGPGSARSLLRALEALRPDVLLVEGPPDAADVLPLAGHADMRPPVALLLHVPDEPRRAVSYPFAAFSPEWVAIRWALAMSVPVRFMDLPIAHQLALEAGAGEAAESPGDAVGSDEPLHDDPMGSLARAAGFADGERFWNQLVEERRDDAAVFDAILEMMAALRDGEAMPEERRREAWMRQTIRAAGREGFERVAVVCGAWHAPALVGDALDGKGRKTADAALLRGLPKVRIRATWVPWTHGRLAWRSGYGAGIESPGWYEHLWTTSLAGADAGTIAARWMTRVARVLRDADLDVSPAHVIEAVRMADALAALRGRAVPGLGELTEATLAVILGGDATALRLVHERLIVGETLGAVPEETPAVPLQGDLAREQRRLRLPPDAAQRILELDLRAPLDRDRSVLLHRLTLLDVPWGVVQHARGRGTFREAWRLQWRPELALAVVEAGRWGNTVADAAAARALHEADAADGLAALAALLDRVLVADLPDAARGVMERVDRAAAIAADVAQLCDALPPLVQVRRYGDVRGTDASLVAHVLDGLVARLCIGLPAACAQLDDDAAAAMLRRLDAVHAALALEREAPHVEAWHATLAALADRVGLHGLLAGRCCRLLLDEKTFTAVEAARRLSLALSPAVDPAAAAAWAEGFLRGSALVLLHDDDLWRVVDAWLAGLSADAFAATLPMVRRAFSGFTAPERRQLGERAARGAGPRDSSGTATGIPGFDADRAAAVLPLVARLLGVAGVAGVVDT